MRTSPTTRPSRNSPPLPIRGTRRSRRQGSSFYTGDKFPNWKGKALLGGLSSEALIVLTLDGDKVVSDEIIKMGRRIRDVAQAPDGAVLLLVDGESGGDLLRLTPSGRAAQR